MTHSVFSCKTSAWLLTVLTMFFGDTTMASSLKLADPSELAGHWLVTLNAAQETHKAPADPSHTCPIELQPNQTLGDGADCLAIWLGEPPSGWFPEPDGIAITGKEGSRILLLSRQHEGLYQGTLQSGQRITLKRQTNPA
ncbi:AprI/Inh family metalloprotease inhibitor [Pseudomonas sp. NFX98]|uniref:AprI/Inh family metalloprotease inhibitor n=1 Tax=Pseudomonas sp. NFX98 TaxID=3399122 RepID=UPI0039FBC29E